jgi:hypothetical protein
MRRVFPPPSDAATFATLLDREEALAARARTVTIASPKHREQIERDLAEVRRLLEQLGYRRTGSGD